MACAMGARVLIGWKAAAASRWLLIVSGLRWALTSTGCSVSWRGRLETHEMRHFQYEDRRTVHGHAFVQRSRLGAPPASWPGSGPGRRPIAANPPQISSVALPRRRNPPAVFNRVNRCPAASRASTTAPESSFCTMATTRSGDWGGAEAGPEMSGLLAGSVPGIMVVIPSPATVRAGVSPARQNWAWHHRPGGNPLQAALGRLSSAGNVVQGGRTQRRRRPARPEALRS